jgi:hypothetical protein
MPTKRPCTPPKRRPLRRAPKRRQATNIDRDGPVSDKARLWAENIVRRMWPALYVKAVDAAPLTTRALRTTA